MTILPKEFTLKCRICGNTVNAQGTKQELEKWLDTDFGECPAGGTHVELGKKRNYLEVIAESEKLSPQPIADEVFVKELQAKGNVVLDGGSGTVKELPSIHSVKGLRHVGFGSFENDEYTFIRTQAPSGTRFYIQCEK